MRPLVIASSVMLLVVLGIVLPASAITINPTYIDNIDNGETWDLTRQGIIQQAIDDWESLLLDDQTIDITFDFKDAGTAYLAQWAGSFAAYPGTDLYPWSSEVTHEIHFNADYFDTEYYTWWDATPTTDEDQPFKAYDALSVTRHELGHALGFASEFYYDDFNITASETDKWASLITGSTFDPGGLDIAMASTTNLGHVLDSGITSGDLMTPTIANSQRRTISTIDTEMLSLAYGYQVAAVPEPSTLAMLVMSIVSLIAFQRRRRS